MIGILSRCGAFEDFIMGKNYNSILRGFYKSLLTKERLEHHYGLRFSLEIAISDNLLKKKHIMTVILYGDGLELSKLGKKSFPLGKRAFLSRTIL